MDWEHGLAITENMRRVTLEQLLGARQMLRIVIKSVALFSKGSVGQRKIGFYGSGILRLVPQVPLSFSSRPVINATSNTPRTKHPIECRRALSLMFRFSVDQVNCPWGISSGYPLSRSRELPSLCPLCRARLLDGIRVFVFRATVNPSPPYTEDHTLKAGHVAKNIHNSLGPGVLTHPARR